MSFEWQLSDIKVCEPHKDEDLTRYFESVVDGLPLHNIFNPSFYLDEKVKILAFRAIVDGKNGLTSFFTVEDKAGRIVKEMSVESHKGLDAPRLIDPKVFVIGDEYYVTFNSGWIPRGNDIFVMKVYPEMAAPKSVIYDKSREQERNWAFFSEEGEIYALYWINPLKLLRLSREGDGAWEMEDYYCKEKPDNTFPEDLTIGTQLGKSNGRYYLVAHQKRFFQNKKVYLGRFCTFDFANREIVPGKYWLSHSQDSILGSDTKHNTNLFSCTYFSGLQTSGISIKLGYGINDVGYGFSIHDPGDL